MKTLFYIVFIVSVLSCSSNEKNISNDDNVEIGTKDNLNSSIVLDKKQNDNEILELDSSILINSLVINFSDSLLKDTLKLLMSGDSVLSAKINYKIVSPKYGIIYDEEFLGFALIGYDIESYYNISIDSITHKQREDFVKMKVDSFFVNSNFGEGAIAKTDSIDLDYSNRENWDCVKNTPYTKSFWYNLYEEDGRRIAFCLEKEKVVIYFNCC